MISDLARDGDKVKRVRLKLVAPVLNAENPDAFHAGQEAERRWRDRALAGMQRPRTEVVFGKPYPIDGDYSEPPDVLSWDKGNIPAALDRRRAPSSETAFNIGFVLGVLVILPALILAVLHHRP